MIKKEKLHVLIVEDSEIDAELCERELKRSNLDFRTLRAWNLETFERALEEFRPDLILSDFSMPGSFDGLVALDMVRARSKEVPFIFVSGTIGEDRAVEALKRGATDYVLKERMSRLQPVVMRALQEAKERETLRNMQDALRESEERFRQLAENIHDIFCLINAHDKQVLYVSPAYEEIWGESRTRLYENPVAWIESVHPEDRERIASAYSEKIHTGQFDFEYRIIRPGGEIRWMRGRGYPIHDAAGRPYRIACIVADITSSKQAEQRISRLNRIYAVLSSINALIVRVHDQDELFQEACRIACDLGHFQMAWIGLVDQKNAVVNPVAYAGDVRDFLDTAPLAVNESTLGRYGFTGQAVRSGKPMISNHVMNDRNLLIKAKELEARGIKSLAVIPLFFGGSVVGVLALYATESGAFDDEEMQLLTGLASDISFAIDHIAKAEKLNYLAYYDELTGLPNRALLEERLNQQLHLAAQNGTKVALLMSDVKRFRLINESLGRQAGDMLLREIADRCKNNWHNQTGVARIAADCFACILDEVRDETAIAHILQNVTNMITASPYSIGEEKLSISTTTGIALFPADGNDAETLFRNVETALKKAKASGDAYLFYQPAMNAKVAETLLLENRLRKAIDKEEFVLHYQPKISLATGKITGLEALIRWNDPESALIAPANFIPLLEETGMILAVGSWAIHRALTDFREWSLQELDPPRIAVNVSAIQLRKSDFVDVILDAVKTSGATPHGLDLEITESLIMDDIEGNIEKLKVFRDAGISIAIDDFGTGYSSLGYLARLPVDMLKIDRSFIDTMTENADNMTIVSTIISLAHSLGLKVVAEGVETENQSRLLKLLKCDEMQGYLFSKPVSFEIMTALLKNR